MNKEEFLNALRNKLVGLPEADVEDRISFYQEMIEDRIDEGKSEEEAINEIGSVDDIVKEIAKDTPLAKLVKEKVRPKRSLRAWEIVLIALGFPLWFPLVVTAFVLALVAYLLIWVWVLVVYTVEISLATAGAGGFIIFLAYLANGNFNITALGASIMSLGGAILLIFGCIGITKGTIKLSRSIVIGIKSTFIKKGRK